MGEVLRSGPTLCSSDCQPKGWLSMIGSCSAVPPSPIARTFDSHIGQAEITHIERNGYPEYTFSHAAKPTRTPSASNHHHGQISNHMWKRETGTPRTVVTAG